MGVNTIPATSPPVAKSVAVVGSDACAAQCALTLADLGLQVDLLAPGLGLEIGGKNGSDEEFHQRQHLWPLLLRAGSHPRINLLVNHPVFEISRKAGRLKVKGLAKPRYVNPDICTGCGDCEAACSVKVQLKVDGKKVSRRAIRPPTLGAKATPSAYFIEKAGIAPCRSKCPLGINVQGFIALLGKGKVDKALSLINESAPMAAILGRLCTHPCESECTRKKVDSAVYIQALHRFCADYGTVDPASLEKAPRHSKKDKIAIIGSGPSGLSAAWELTRRGYGPTVFESHAVVGGMLATGIPRFRLPREVREKDVDAIKSMGVDFKTGVAVGRDVTYSDLVERGYSAFYLAIGAQQNNRLNVPGENLKGVLDAISLLFALNIHMEDTVGSDVIVVGGGNSAVDSARSAKRVSKGQVRILCLTPSMTAVKEDVDEALKEGVIIDYNVTVKEIMGQEGTVCGVTCHKVENVAFLSDGKIKMDFVAGSEFSLAADRVVIAIGQRPGSAALNIKGLALHKNGTIETDPLTLQTSIEGVFAGGDCVSGSNNVVDSMAAGIRAAESIDRYLAQKELRKARSIEPGLAVEADIESRKISTHRRAAMPGLPLAKRKHNYEETNLGLSPGSAQNETERCLNCAVCCECLECVEACKLKAVQHDEQPRPFEIESSAVVDFTGAPEALAAVSSSGAHQFLPNSQGDIRISLAEAASLAFKVALDLELKELHGKHSPKVTRQQKGAPAVPAHTDTTAIVLCRCGENISSVLDFPQLVEDLGVLDNVVSVRSISQACTPEGAGQIRQISADAGASRLVLAACRCCNLDQVCFSCSDRRVMCQHNLNVELAPGVAVEFANIREQCAWLYREDPGLATARALEIIKSAAVKARQAGVIGAEEREISPGVLVIATGPSGLAAAEKVAAAGIETMLLHFPRSGSEERIGDGGERSSHRSLARLRSSGVLVVSWGANLSIVGRPGSYRVSTGNAGREINFAAGSIILDLAQMEGETLAELSRIDLIKRIIDRQNLQNQLAVMDSTLIHAFTIGETAGIFAVLSGPDESNQETISLGEAAASRALAFVKQQMLKARTNSVLIQAQFCRGCGDCARLCSYIALKEGGPGLGLAEVDPSLCLGCGACVSVCPTGAIIQPLQSEAGLRASLESVFEGSSL
jgi:NADPH-dependent glutamate synthase beta subunit-like oxidoreductase/NAD-dependent dihydropyrimidine dehydrogenase PreA subunit